MLEIEKAATRGKKEMSPANKDVSRLALQWEERAADSVVVGGCSVDHPC